MSAAGRRGLRPLACAVACTVVVTLPRAEEPPRRCESCLADLAPAALAEIGEAVGDLAALPPAAQPEAVYRGATPRELKVGPLAVRADARWFSTLPPGGEGAPLLVLRRWPGDTALAFYAVRGSAGTAPTVAGARLERGGPGEWRGELDTPAGPRPAVWLAREVPGARSHLGALLLPGDAGLGEGAIADLELESRVVFERVEIEPRGWAVVEGQAAGVGLVAPDCWSTAGAGDESLDPWQVVQGEGFTLGLPPGIRARRPIEGLSAGRQVAGIELWFRGRYRDESGSAVAIGDGSRAGYVAAVPEPSEPWQRNLADPLGAPGARRLADEPFAVAAERIEAKSVRVGRWDEPGFAGEWLVFRVALDPLRGLEIGLPLVEGAQSPSPYWIPLTWRPADRPPAPPPIDPAERFGIRFDRLGPVARSRTPFLSGYLSAPGIRLEVPDGWLPAASLRSADGFPVRFIGAAGSPGSLSRLDAAEVPDPGASGWSPIEKGGGRWAAAALGHADGHRIFVSKDGVVFWFRRGEGEDADGDPDRWARMLDSVRLTRAEP